MSQSSSTTLSESGVFTVAQRSASGAQLADLQIEASRLDKRVRHALLKEALVMYHANRRQGTHDTKTRSEVAGSMKKLWRQKGTGRARPGSCKNPIWRGGGTVFGPHPRDYSYSINRKQRQLAVKSALYSKFLDGCVTVIDRIDIDSPSTKKVVNLLKALGVQHRCLIGTADVDQTLVLSARNIPKVKVLPVGDFNAEEILKARSILLSSDAFDLLSADPAPESQAASEVEADITANLSEATGATESSEKPDDLSEGTASGASSDGAESAAENESDADSEKSAGGDN